MLRTFITSATLLLTALPASAASFTSYTDRSSFLTDAGAASLITTNEALAADPGDPFTISDGLGASVTLDIVQGVYSTSLFSCGGCFAENNLFDGLIELVSTQVTGRVVGIGFDHTAQFDSTADINVNNGGATASNTFNGASFLGLMSTDGGLLNSVSLDLDAPEFPMLWADNIVIVTAPVPLPASVLLLGSVLAFGSSVAHRAKRRANTRATV